MEKHEFSTEYTMKKQAMLAALAQTKPRQTHIGVRAAAIAAAAALLTVGTVAAVRYVDFSMEHEENEVHIHAGISDTAAPTDEPKPLRSWNAREGEVSVMVSFGWLPQDISENPTTPYKFGGTDVTRSMTVSGIDLRRGDFDTTMLHADTTESFAVGENTAYLVTMQGVSLYNKVLYVLFDAEELLVKAQITNGISVEEVKQIAAGMSVSETDDTAKAMPIANEEFSSDVPRGPAVVHVEVPKLYREDLYAVGETAVYDRGIEELCDAELSLESIETADSIAVLDGGEQLRDDAYLRRFTDDTGALVPYTRTEFIPGDAETPSRFGESRSITKRLFILTVAIEYENEIPPFLHTFRLSGLAEHEDGSITSSTDIVNYVYNETPGVLAGTHDCIWRKDLGDGRWQLAYLLDEDECETELFWYSSFAKIGYSFVISE